jgi:hypothetical protein
MGPLRGKWDFRTVPPFEGDFRAIALFSKLYSMSLKTFFLTAEGAEVKKI